MHTVFGFDIGWIKSDKIPQVISIFGVLVLFSSGIYGPKSMALSTRHLAGPVIGP